MAESIPPPLLRGRLFSVIGDELTEDDVDMTIRLILPIDDARTIAAAHSRGTVVVIYALPEADYPPQSGWLPPRAVTGGCFLTIDYHDPRCTYATGTMVLPVADVRAIGHLLGRWIGLSVELEEAWNQ